MLFLLLVPVLFSASYGQRTFGDVRKCTTDSYRFCKSQCSGWYPDYKDWEKVQKCFDEKRKAFQACMVTQGTFISDSTRCYPLTSSGWKADDNEEIHNAAKCYKRCLKRQHKKCRNNCTGKPSGNEAERKKKLDECKNDEDILDCLEAES